MVHQCVHHLPGRLRLRVPALKRAPQLCRRLAARLQAEPGIIGVEASDATGSLLIRYHPGRFDPACVTALVRAAGVAGTVPPSPFDTLTRQLGNALAGKMADVVLEKAALALVAALL